MRISIIDKFEETAARKRDETAIVHGSASVTFGELRRLSLSAAAFMLGKDIERGKPIAVFLGKSINAAAADIAVMQTGCPFVDLDIKTPGDRIKNTVGLLRPQAVITDSKNRQAVQDLGIPVFDVDEITSYDCDTEEVCKKLVNFRAGMIDTDPMCIINTSGSTGTPKGVVLNNRSFFDFMDWAVERFGFDGSEIMGSLSPIVFDIFDFELCMLITLGTGLVLLDASLAAFPIRLLEEVNKEHVSFIFWVPSIMVNIANLDLLAKVPLPELRTVWFAGEVFPTKQFLYWYDKLPDARFVNMYGPIEITLDCTYHEVTSRPSEDEALPIGVPCRNTDILILGTDDRPCGTDEEGELCVRGTSLAMGYYNDPEKTRAAFTQNPLNSAYPELIYRTGDIVCRDSGGLIHFRGRKDSLIKHMGYRIELGEIEHVLINGTGLVKYCCCVYRKSKKEIVLYYESEADISAADFRSALRSRLPAYMIPTVYMRLDQLPRNTNGKIDRHALNSAANS